VIFLEILTLLLCGTLFQLSAAQESSQVLNVVKLLELPNVLVGNVNCTAETVAGVLRDPSQGLPTNLRSGTIISLKGISCGSAGLGAFLRAVKEVKLVSGSSAFTIETISLNLDTSTCTPEQEFVLSPGGERVCVRRADLPAVSVVASYSDQDAEYTHLVVLTVSEGDLSRMVIPGVTEDDVYLVFVVTNDLADPPKPQCGLPRYSPPQHTTNRTSIAVRLSAPFYICARACPVNPLLRESRYIELKMDGVPGDRAEPDHSNSPINFVDNLDELRFRDSGEGDPGTEDSDGIPPAIIGLIVACCVSVVLIIVVTFTVVRCTSSYPLQLISRYIGSGSSSWGSRGERLDACTPCVHDPLGPHGCTGTPSSGRSPLSLQVSHNSTPHRPPPSPQGPSVTSWCAQVASPHRSRQVVAPSSAV